MECPKISELDRSQSIAGQDQAWPNFHGKRGSDLQDDDWKLPGIIHPRQKGCPGETERAPEL